MAETETKVEDKKVHFDLPSQDADVESDDDKGANDITAGANDSTHLMEQNLETLDCSKLTPLTPEVISRQATINIGTMIMFLIKKVVLKCENQNFFDIWSSVT